MTVIWVHLTAASVSAMKGDNAWWKCDMANVWSCELNFCKVTFDIDEDVTGPLLLYYELENFYQNHRRYFQSKSFSQLSGQNLDSSEVSITCNPLVQNGSLLLNPCGLIANSFFNGIVAGSCCLFAFLLCGPVVFPLAINRTLFSPSLFPQT